MSQLIILTGRVGKQPETRKFQKGQVSNFSLAVSEKYTTREGEKKEHTEWFNCQVSDKLSEVVEKWVNKGDLIQVVGKQRTRKYESNGQEKQAVEILCHTLEMLGSKREEDPMASNSSHQKANAADMYGGNPEDDDLPF